MNRAEEKNNGEKKVPVRSPDSREPHRLNHMSVPSGVCLCCVILFSFLFFLSFFLFDVLFRFVNPTSIFLKKNKKQKQSPRTIGI